MLTEVFSVDLLSSFFKIDVLKSQLLLCLSTVSVCDIVNHAGMCGRSAYYVTRQYISVFHCAQSRIQQQKTQQVTHTHTHPHPHTYTKLRLLFFSSVLDDFENCTGSICSETLFLIPIIINILDGDSFGRRLVYMQLICKTKSNKQQETNNRQIVNLKCCTRKAILWSTLFSS